MTPPVLQIEGVLLASIQEALEDTAALALKRALLDGLRRTRAPGVLLDVSGVDLVDSFTARVFAEIGGAARLMGAEVVLVGLQPEVAMTMVELGLELHSVATELDVNRGLQRIHERLRARSERRPGGT